MKPLCSLVLLLVLVCGLVSCGKKSEGGAAEPEGDDAWERLSTPAQIDEAQKKQIFAEVYAANDRAVREADQRFPATDMKSFNANNRLLQELTERYRNEVMQRHGITEEDLEKIMFEGVVEEWPW